MTARTLTPFDPAVVAPWIEGEGRRGALLLHGFAGTPPELHMLGRHLAASGWRCRGPALAGHATAPEDLAATSWRDWAASVDEALDELLNETDHVIICGQSMGGTLALHAAALRPEIEAVVTLAAPIHIGHPGAPLLPVAKYLIRWHYPNGESDLYRREGLEELYSYGKRSMHATAELFQLMRRVSDELALIRQPVLLLQGARDSVVPPRNVGLIRSRLICSRQVDRRLYPRSGHALSVDVDREEINELIGRWLDHWVPAQSGDEAAGDGDVEASAAS